jgi:2-dehydro-3-deoxy-D-arabinonate dehydratase
MKLYRTKRGYLIEQENRFYAMETSSWNCDAWDSLITCDDLYDRLLSLMGELQQINQISLEDVLAPIGTQEVWAAGVTYYRSRDARMEESKAAGGADFYDRVYNADRPELFFKATPQRVVGPHAKVAIRDDARWSVPEPELTLLITPGGVIVGYTIGNDMSSRDIEGENPLYLPQAKVYDRSCALGPCIRVADEPLPASTEIKLEVLRDGKAEFSGATALSEMKRDPASLVQYLYRNNTFHRGAFLLTGTGIVPPDSFGLKLGDEIRITIDGIGTLVNQVG